MFVPWNRIDLTIYPSRFYCDMIPTPPLCPPSRGDCCLGAENVICYVVAAVHRIRDIFINHEYEVIFPLLDEMNRLEEAEPMAILNVVCPQIEFHGAGRPMLGQRRRHVPAVNVRQYHSGETYDHISPLPLIYVKSPVKKLHNTS